VEDKNESANGGTDSDAEPVTADSITVRALVTKDGRSPFQEWYDGLRDKVARGRIVSRIARVRIGNFGDFKSVGRGVYELRVDYGPGYRVYFGKVGDTLVLLVGGGDKSTQEKDIRKAQDIWEQHGENTDAKSRLS
jgi:putative addiction module killer protein